MKSKTIYIILIIISLMGISYIIFPNQWKSILKPKNNPIIEVLQKENEQLKLETIEINKERQSLKEGAIKDSLDIVNLKKEIVKIDEDLVKKDKDIIKNKTKLDKVLTEQKSTKDKITKLKESPNEKRGEELLLSVGKRLK